MVELYDVLALSLQGHVPLESTKYDESFSSDCLYRIQSCLLKHDGEMVLAYHKDGKRNEIPTLAQIYMIVPCGVVLRYKCYDPEGCFRTYLSTTITWGSIYCRDVKLRLFGDI